MVTELREEALSTPRALFRQPLALQWFDDGKLVKRCEQERTAGRFELFLDLLYVAILANFAENLAEHPSGLQVLKYILILTPSWHVWSDLRELMNSFYNDDLLQRVLILWIMAVLVIYGNNAVLVEDLDALRATTAACLVARISANSAHLLYSFASYHHRAQQRLWVCASSVALCAYIPLFFERLSIRGKIAAAIVGIVTEEILWVLCYSPAVKKLLGARYTTAVDIPHEVDRFAAFYIIVLGEFLYRIVVGSPAAVGLNERLLRAVWTLIIAFCLNWLYTHADGSVQGTHALRHNIWASFGWVLLHLPLAAFLLAGGHAAANTAGEDLHGGELWLLAGGLGGGLILLWMIALLNRDEDEKGTLHLPKPLRLILRPIVGIVICSLRLAHLETTPLMSIIMALFVVTVLWETITSLLKGSPIFERWENTGYPKHRDSESAEQLAS